MSEISYKKLARPLERSEIDFRVGSVSLFNGEATATILAYKDARVDMKILDEVYGELWQVEYIRDPKGVLFCKIGLWIATLNQWVWRTSNGIESNTEKTKGEASDALKRAGFMCGIGRELYDMPVIKVKLDKSEFDIRNEGGKDVAKVKGWFKPNDWTWAFDIAKQTISAKDTKGNLKVNIKEGQDLMKGSNGTTPMNQQDNAPSPPQNEPQANSKKVEPMTEKEFSDLGAEVKAARDEEELKVVWDKYPKWHTHTAFNRLVKDHKKYLVEYFKQVNSEALAIAFSDKVH